MVQAAGCQHRQMRVRLKTVHLVRRREKLRLRGTGKYVLKTTTHIKQITLPEQG